MMLAIFWKTLSLVILLSYIRVSAWNLNTGRGRGYFGWHPLTSSIQQQNIQNSRPGCLVLFSSDSSSDNGKRSLSASDRERRDEEKRRRQRQDEVVIGKTSALRDAQDYQLNPKATEEEWLRQATREEQMVYRLTEQGLENLKMLQLEQASNAFDQVFQIKPDAYLWQAGIAKFYLDDIEGAADLFARNAALYERKFGPASEERIWRQACELKLISMLDKRAREKQENKDKIASKLTPIPELKADPESLFTETRKVIRIAGDLFTSSVNNDQSGVILARAKLRSIGGNFDDIPRFDIKLWRLNAWFYLGLHYDAIGELDESKECMKMALRNCPSSGNGDNIVHVLPLMHMSRRDWFDDDDLDADPLQLLRHSSDEEESSNEEEDEDMPKLNKIGNLVDADPLVSDSIRNSISKMRLFELQDALRVRGIKVVGSKAELQKRLFRSLMDDAGLA